MVSRRELLTGGVMGGFARQDVVTAVQIQESAKLVAGKLGDIENAVKVVGDGSALPSNTVSKVRDAMMIFVRANAKFPDYCEVGIGIFFDIYDWHVKNQRELTIGRQPDGRYALQFMFTRLLLRHDTDPNFVGFAYDVR